jgi:hypothetical protein
MQTMQPLCHFRITQMKRLTIDHENQTLTDLEAGLRLTFHRALFSDGSLQQKFAMYNLCYDLCSWDCREEIHSVVVAVLRDESVKVIGKSFRQCMKHVPHSIRPLKTFLALRRMVGKDLAWCILEMVHNELHIGPTHLYRAGRSVIAACRYLGFLWARNTSLKWGEELLRDIFA